MSNTVGGTTVRPASQHEEIRGLLRAGRNDEAIVRLCAISIVRPEDPEVRRLLFDAFFQKRDWAPALVLAEQLACALPNNPQLEKTIIATLSNMRRYQEAIPKACNTLSGMAKI